MVFARRTLLTLLLLICKPTFIQLQANRTDNDLAGRTLRVMTLRKALNSSSRPLAAALRPPQARPRVHRRLAPVRHPLLHQALVAF